MDNYEKDKRFSLRSKTNRFAQDDWFLSMKLLTVWKMFDLELEKLTGQNCGESRFNSHVV